jgi:2-polyprenyl-3-methyl-5-hydroxy-6-metoxy-1,4-benzoquinol methylase
MTLAPASFRDPSGRCFVFPDRVYRFLDPESAAICSDFLQTNCAKDLFTKGRLIASRRLTESDLALLKGKGDLQELFGPNGGGAIFEHERVPFVSYPYEWPPEMLWEAGRLTLELARAALAEGYGLKDATPYNILYRGPNAVFVDVPSFERRDPNDPVWLAQAQLVRTFLLPLLINQRRGLCLADIFTTHRDGLEPEEVYRWCGVLERLKPNSLSLVSIPTWLKGRATAQGTRLYESRRMDNPEKARFILESLLERSQRTLNRLRPGRKIDSRWSEYMATHSYTEPEFAEKEKFVDEALRQIRPERVLDVGANTGHFSMRAADVGARVVAIDADATCIGRLWDRAANQKKNILPLVVNWARPTAALGWKNAECLSFLQRSRGNFDCVLMLAVVHHLLVTERIPLQEILLVASEVTTSWLLIEYVGPQDDMFRQLTRGREELHAGLNETKFEGACAAHFDIVRSSPLAGKARRMYLLKRKG